jgi:hypothetical protein
MGQAPQAQTEVEAHLVFELERRLAEDDAAPDDTIAWTDIRTEAQARWQTNQGATNEHRHTLK